MAEPDDLRYTRIPLDNGSGAIPALGFGTLIPDVIAAKNATKAALEAGFRQLDTSERYRSNSTTSISIPSTPHLLSNLETSKTRGTQTAM